jgi:chaperonin GroES
MSECHSSDIFFVRTISFPVINVSFNISKAFGMNYDKGKSEILNENYQINFYEMAKLNIKPLGDRVVVEPAEAETKTATGIIIPDTAKEKPQRGIIVAVGNGKVDEPLTVKEGDAVLYGKFAGTEITVDGKEYLIMRESDIYAIV